MHFCYFFGASATNDQLGFSPRRFFWHIRLLCFVFLAICSFLSLAIAQVPPKEDRALETVRLQLKWRHQFQFAGYYAAVEKGYFREAGLTVELMPGTPEANPSGSLLSGQAEYAVMSPAVLLERQLGKPLMVLGAIFQHSANIILTRKDAGLFTPQDLKGKRIMFSPESDPENRAMLVNEGISPDIITFLPHNWSIDDLVNGQVDGQTAYLTNEPYLLKKRGIEPALIKPINYGGSCKSLSWVLCSVSS